MISRFQIYIDRLSRNPDSSALRRAMQEIAAGFDLTSFAYLLSMKDRPADVKLISNYPEGWTRHYLAKEYDRLDPVIRQVYRRSRPFQWGEGHWPRILRRAEADFMQEASSFGIRCGFTFPIEDPECRFAAVTFASDQGSDRFQRCFETHGGLLHVLAMMFHAEARRALAPSQVIGGVSLTSRELECLTWAARGKSSWDTSQILGISQRTVVFHLSNAKTKLNVRSIQQAVALLASSRSSNQ